MDDIAATTASRALTEQVNAFTVDVEDYFHVAALSSAVSRESWSLRESRVERNTELAEVAAWAPEDRILIETDSPYLAPPPFRGKRNEPRHVRLIAERIAELRHISLHALASITTRNAEALFRLPSPQTEKGNSTDAPVQYP